jgi:hypothetical protein
MSMRHGCRLLAVLTVVAAFSISSVSLAADNKAENPEPDRASSQAQVETLDFTMVGESCAASTCSRMPR